MTDIVETNRQHLQLPRKKQIGFDNVRERGSLEWVLDCIQYPLFNQHLYPTIVEKAAILTWIIITGHVFWNGNKRTGTSVLITFLKWNGYLLNTTSDEIVDLARTLAGEWPDRHLSFQDLVCWIRERIYLIQK